MIYLCEINFQKELARYNKVINSVNEERQKEILEYYNMTDRIIRVYSELLVKKSIELEYEINRSDIVIQRPLKEKPSLTWPPGIFFNVSHASNIVVCQISEQQVGIDVEKVVSIDWDTLNFFATEEEQRYILNGNCELECYERYFKIWTIKESVLKKMGVGLYSDPKKVQVQIKDNLAKVIFKGNSYNVYQCHIKDGYILSSNEKIEKICYLNPDTLLI